MITWWEWVWNSSCIAILAVLTLPGKALAELPGGTTRDPELGIEIRELEPALEEISPVIVDVNFKLKNESLISVILSGNIASCYNKHEYLLTKEKLHTKLVPRFKRKSTSLPCNLKKMDSFSEEAAELPLGDPASKELWVLSFKGWQQIRLPEKFFENISNEEYGPLPSPAKDLKSQE